MERWIVTGGAGFIGSNFVRLALRETDARVVVVDKLTYAGSRLNLAGLEEHPRFRFVRLDIADRAGIEALFAEERPTAVVHFAAETHVDRSIESPAAFLETNVVGTFVLLEASRSLLAQLDSKRAERFRFLQISTDEVYGALGRSGRFSEQSRYAPNSPYAASKASADHWVRAYGTTFGLPTLITHCSNNFGPYQFPEKLIPLMILNAIEGRPLPVYGDGQHVRDWIYVEDHCAGVLAVLERGRPGERYHIGAHNECTNLELVRRLCRHLEAELPAERNPRLRERGIRRYEDLVSFVEDRPGHDRRYAIDASKIERELGWRPAHGFDAALRETVRWYLAHRDWCEAVQAGRYHRERLGRLPERGRATGL